MSFRMVWANFTNPSLHLLEQPLMVAAGRQALLSMPRREGFRSARPWPLEPAWASPERGRHPGRSWNSTAASAGSPASASREPAGHAVGSLPLSFPPLKSYPREELGMPGLGQRCQGTGRSQGTEEERAAERSWEGRWSSPRRCWLSFLQAVAMEQLILPSEGRGLLRQNTPFRSFPAGSPAFSFLLHLTDQFFGALIGSWGSSPQEQAAAAGHRGASLQAASP